MALNNDKSMNCFLKNIEQYKFIAHRLGFLMEGYPENSLDNVISIFNNQETLDAINGIEFDIQFTANHIPIIIHDLSTADISEMTRVVGKIDYDDLKDIKCGYRRSDYNSNIPWGENNNFNLQTLNTILSFFMDNKAKLDDKIIKIETKFPLLTKEDILALKELLDKYKYLNENIMHISFFPWNLRKLRELEKEESSKLTRTEVLIDFSFERPFTKIWNSSIDGISLGLKNEHVEGNMEISKEAKRMAGLNAAFYERRNAVSEKWLKKIIEKYGYVGLYTINDIKNISELLNRVSHEFLDEYAEKLMITSDNPVYLKRLK